MELEELKALLDIEIDDLSEDIALRLKLDGITELTEKWFLENAKKEYISYDNNGKFIIPPGAKIAMAKYVEATTIPAGVRSESIGGMTQDFGGGSSSSSNGSLLDDFYAYLEIYKNKDISFIPFHK